MRKVLLVSMAMWGALMLSCSPEKMPDVSPIAQNQGGGQNQQNNNNEQNNNNQQDNQGQETTPAISVNPSSLSFESGSSSKTVAVTSNVTWSYECYDSWLTIKKDSPSQLTVSVSSNTSSARNASIYLTEQGKSTTLAVINVSQIAVVSTGGSDKTFTVSGNGKTVTFKLVYIQGGTFTMGATEEQGEDAYRAITHSVTLKDYCIGETEVTQALWYAIMGEEPISDLPYYLKWWYGFGEGDNYPAYSISYVDCQDFINKLNAKTGEAFRLPTEAEWEFAARGGRKTGGYRYAGSNFVDDVAWYFDNCYEVWQKCREVATKRANELGIYDMSGSVQEWCSDWYGDFNGDSQINPQGPLTGERKVCRNGSWENGELMLRVAARFSGGLNDHSTDCGMRLAHD